MSVEKAIIQMHSQSLAARPTEVGLFHASGNLAKDLAFLMC
jgi:hypothetical protein